MDTNKLLKDEIEFVQINQLYDECLDYLKTAQYNDKKTQRSKTHSFVEESQTEPVNKKYTLEDTVAQAQNGYSSDPDYESIKETPKIADELSNSFIYKTLQSDFKVENEKKPKEHYTKVGNAMKAVKPPTVETELKSGRLRRLSEQLPRIIITQSNTSLEMKKDGKVDVKFNIKQKNEKSKTHGSISTRVPQTKHWSLRPGYGDFPRRLICKNGFENVALISNVPYEKIRMLNDTFHTLINLRWRWIISGTILLHFTIWLVFAVFWYIAALAHYDFEPDPPKRSCVTGGKDFVTIFLASVEAQTTIGFGDRTIDEECPESIFLFIMQLILGTGLSGVLTCVVYAKLTRPEKLSRDGVGFSKKAVISLRDGQLCLMMRAWDLNHDHIISSEFSAHFVRTHRTKEGEVIRYYARSLELQQRQFLLWPLTLVHVIDETSPLYGMTPQNFANYSYEITVSLKGASASMGTFTQSQTSYLPNELAWGYRFPSVVKYDSRKQKYVIEHKKLDLIEPIETPFTSASHLYSSTKVKPETPPPTPGTPGSFSDRVTSFHLERSSSFRSTKSESKDGAEDKRPGTPGSFSGQLTAFHHERSPSFRSTKSESKDSAEDRRPGTPSSFSGQLTAFHLERSSSFRTVRGESKT